MYNMTNNKHSHKVSETMETYMTQNNNNNKCKHLTRIWKGAPWMRIEIIIERSLVKSKQVNSGELEALDHGNAAWWNQNKLTGMQQRSNTQHDVIVGLTVQHLTD